MYALSYRSTLGIGYNVDDLDSLREESQVYNSENHITGCLFFYHGELVGIIEGKKRAILRIYANMRTDPRYHRPQLLWAEAETRRYFDDWGMEYYTPYNGSTDISEESRFKSDLLLLQFLAEKPTAALLTFWAALRAVLMDGSTTWNYVAGNQ